jgi:hypothetical protein
MILDNIYRCTSVDPVKGSMILSSTQGHGTVVVIGNGLVSLQAGKTYRVHVDIDVWHGNHQLSISEES